MQRETTVGQVLVNAMLPEDLRDYNRVITKSSMNKLMTELIRRHPDQTKHVLSQLTKVGYRTAYLTGGQSFSLDNMAPMPISKKMQKELNKEVQQILFKAYRKGKSSTDPEVSKAILDATARWYPIVEKELDNDDLDKNGLFRQHKGTQASKPGTYRSIRIGDLVYVDQDNKPVPIPVTRSYTQGLTPIQYFAGSFGARKGCVDLQSATQDAGFLAKQLVQIAHRLVVTADDDDDPEHEADNAQIGYPTTVDDPDNEGSFLAIPVAGYKRNTCLTPKILEDMKRRGVKNIVTRSVIAGGPGNGGIYAYDAGIRERGTLPTQGDFVGINAVAGITEPVTQAAISSKHSGGVAGASSGQAISGFSRINQMIQVPKHYTGGATHSQFDGRVSSIVNAPQGGKYIFVDNNRHYVKAENCNAINVKVGDTVEAGDVMTGGIPNPAEIVKYKGIGEGRRYFVDMFRDALKSAGSSAHRRNIEALSRGLINYVRCTEEIGDYCPDDVVPYCTMAANWKPRSGFTQDTPEHSKGRFLEKPVLHYTIGTRITPSVIKTLKDYKIPNISTHKDPPPFEPEMIRGMGHVAEDPDWCTRLLGAYNKESLLEGARRGSVSNTYGTSYVPAIALGTPEFGQYGFTKQLPLNEFAKKEGY